MIMKKLLPIFLLSWLLLILSCSEDDSKQALQDDHSAETGHYHKGIISFAELKSKLNDKPVRLLAAGLSGRGGEDYIQSVDSTNIIEITYGDLTTYTLNVHTLDDEEYYLSNLIIREEADSILEVIVHYQPSLNWITEFEAGNYLEYDGEIKVVDTEGEDFSEDDTTGKMYCTFSVETTSTCTCGPAHVEGDPNCTCTTFENTYNIKVNCGYSGGGSGGGSGDDDDPGTGGGGGGIPTEPIPDEGETPCQSLALKTDANFRYYINRLKSLLNSPDENGYFNYNPNEVPGQNSNATNQYNIMSSKTRADGKKRVRTTVAGPQVFGYMHTHPIDDDVMGVHSTGDIFAFAELLTKRSSYGYSLSETYCIVVGEHGIYSLKLEDFSKFNDWTLEYDTETKRRKFFEDFEKKYFDLRAHESTRTNNERSILKMLDQYYDDLGIGMYRAVESNNTITGWERMTLSENGNPEFTNCNEL